MVGLCAALLLLIACAVPVGRGELVGEWVLSDESIWRNRPRPSRGVIILRDDGTVSATNLLMGVHNKDGHWTEEIRSGTGKWQTGTNDGQPVVDMLFDIEPSDRAGDGAGQQSTRHHPLRSGTHG
jgi:hypothetical protein